MALALLFLALLAPAVLAGSPFVQHLQTSQFSGFLQLLEYADLVPVIESSLNDGNSLTVFAPTDDALMYRTSPTLLAFLKLKENKESLRKLLLSHIVAEKLSPFHWEGAKLTLQGTPLKLSMDSAAFYAGDVAVTQYNALSMPEFAVHSLPALIIPAELASSSKSLIEEVTEVRRALQGVTAAAPAPGSGFVDDAPGGSRAPVLPKDVAADGKGAAAQAVASIAVLVAAMAMALS